MKKKRIDPLVRNAVTKAVLKNQLETFLSQLKASAELQALFGDAAHRLVHDSGILLFSVAYACSVCRVSDQEPDVRILRGMAQALGDLAERLQDIEQHRPAIQSGLAAIERLLPRLDIFALGLGFVDCTKRISSQGISSADIQSFLGGEH